MNQQDLIWLKLPFTTMKESKIRPAVVVSNDSYNKKSSDIIVCAITSNIEEKPYSILITSDNLSEGKLPLKSRIRADKILQVEKSLIIKKFARLDNKTYDILITEIEDLVKRK